MTLTPLHSLRPSSESYFASSMASNTFVLIVLMMQFLAGTSESSVRKSRYQTAYACEDTQLNITCGHDGRRLNIIRANYGRFSIAICNEDGNTEWSVNCMTTRTLHVMRTRCEGAAVCNVPVDSTIFGDPCPGTFKYVEVHYSCEHEVIPSTTARPRPPWFPETPPNGWTELERVQDGANNATYGEEDDDDDTEDWEDESDYRDREEIAAAAANENRGHHIQVEVPKPFVAESSATGPELELTAVTVPVPRPSQTLRPDRLAETDDAIPRLKDLMVGQKAKNAAAAVDSSYRQQKQAVVVPILRLANYTQYCPPSGARGLSWNWTAAGDTAVLECPSGSVGFAKWRCGGGTSHGQQRHAATSLSLLNGGGVEEDQTRGRERETVGEGVDWATPTPSLADCQSKWLNNLDARLRDGEAVGSVSADLAQLSGLQPLYGGDLQLATRMLKHMAERMHYDVQGVVGAEERSSERRGSLVTDLVQNVVLTASNILDRVNHVSWTDLTSDDVAGAATALMVGLEENAFLLANSVTSEKIIIKPTTNILLSIRVMQARNAQPQRFPTVENLEMWHHQDGEDGPQDSIQLSARSLVENSENGAVRIVFAAYNEFDELLLPVQHRPLSPADHARSAGAAASGMSLSRGGGPTTNHLPAVLRFVNSKVISASLGKGRHTRLPDPVQITLKHLRTVNVSRPVCVFWDYTARAWSGSGCRLVATNATHTQCECDHLTNFAVVMEEGVSSPVSLGGGSNSPGAVPLSSVNGKSGGGGLLSTHVTTIIACVATLVCVTLMLFALVMTWRKFKVTRQCRSMLQNSGIPCFHKTKELSEKDKKQGNFYTVTPKLNSSTPGTNVNGTLGPNGMLVLTNDDLAGLAATESNGGPMLNGEAGGSRETEANNDGNIELNNEQYFQHMLNMQKNQETLRGLVNNKTMSRRNTLMQLQSKKFNDEQAEEENELQETSLGPGSDTVDLGGRGGGREPEHRQATLKNGSVRKSTKSKANCQNSAGAGGASAANGGGQATVMPTGSGEFTIVRNGQQTLCTPVGGFPRAMSPFNHIYMEIDPRNGEDNGMYEVLNGQQQQQPNLPTAFMANTMMRQGNGNVGGNVMGNGNIANMPEGTYMLSSAVSDLSDEDFRRSCSNSSGGASRQSSSRYAENKPLIRQVAAQPQVQQTQQQPLDRNLLNTISGIMMLQSSATAHQQPHRYQNNSLRIASSSAASNGDGTRRTSILSTISGLRYTDPSLPGQPAINLATGESLEQPAAPLQVTTVNGNQFVCLNLNQQQQLIDHRHQDSGHNTSTYVATSELNGGGSSSLYGGAGGMSSMSDTYATSAAFTMGTMSAAAVNELRGMNTAQFVNNNNNGMLSGNLNSAAAMNHQHLQQQQQLVGHPQQTVVMPTGVGGGADFQPGHIQTPVHSQLVIQRIGTLPRQFAHPLAQS